MLLEIICIKISITCKQDILKSECGLRVCDKSNKPVLLEKENKVT
jgi:hypothetical protein